MRRILIVGAEDTGQRIDRYLAACCPEASRSYLQKLLKEGQVQVEGGTVKSSYQVGEGDAISVDIPEAVEPEILAEPIDLDILYEDRDIIVVNKPKGMVVHPGAGHISQTLVNGLMHHCGGDLSGINGVMRPGIVHRIDRDTTGVMVACKNDVAHRDLASQLKEHSITRRYQAIVHGAILDDGGTVDAAIGRHPTDRKKMSIQAKNGKRAVTHYQVLERYSQYTYIECRLETGRTHQIRVHMASIRHPLLGDMVYGPSGAAAGGPSWVRQRGIRMEGQTLHAQVLGFQHPRTREYMEFEAPLPAYFQSLLDGFRGRL